MDKILVVDDMEQNIELMSKYLVNAGFDVMTANSGALAIRKSKLFKPDLILLDLIMPGISGFDVCKTLRNDDETKYTLILVITALDTKETRTRAMEAGADDYMTKSFDKTLLISKVKSLLRIKQLRNQVKEQFIQMQEKDRIMEYQIKMARQVQRSIIREFDVVMNSVSVVSKYMPALEIGGDFYDAAHIAENKVGIIIGDVSGHGISAALLTAMLKMMFRNLIVNHSQPDDLLQRMNQEFCNIFDNKSTDVYACAFCALIDTKEKTIKYANAGMPQSLFFDSSGERAFELNVTGVPIGLMDGTTYDMDMSTYRNGDVLMSYTDGLSDSFHKETPEVFLKTLKEIIVAFASDSTSHELIEMIINQFYNQSNEARYANDDVSIIICRL